MVNTLEEEERQGIIKTKNSKSNGNDQNENMFS